ncbi:hypothetical protein CCACVL1_01475, partial [Corchorus capsularis]
MKEKKFQLLKPSHYFLRAPRVSLKSIIDGDHPK